MSAALVLGAAVSASAAWPGTPSPVTPNTYRVPGANRYATAVATARAFFNQANQNQPTMAFMASGEVFADALVGGAAAGALNVPMLLTRTGALPTEVRDYLMDSSATGGGNITHIYLIGGTSAVSAAVATELAGIRGITVTRVAGANRYETAVAVQMRFFPGATEVGIATGDEPWDALAASAAAGFGGHGGTWVNNVTPDPVAPRGMPILLVNRDMVPTATQDAFLRQSPARLDPSTATTGIANAAFQLTPRGWPVNLQPTALQVAIIGGPAAVSTAVSTWIAANVSPDLMDVTNAARVAWQAPFITTNTVSGVPEAGFVIPGDNVWTQSPAAPVPAATAVANRFGTAVAVANFANVVMEGATTNTAFVVVGGTEGGGSWADALSAAPAAANWNYSTRSGLSPILLTNREGTALAPATLAALTSPTGVLSDICYFVIIGGTAAISPAVADQLDDIGKNNCQ